VEILEPVAALIPPARQGRDSITALADWVHAEAFSAARPARGGGLSDKRFEISA
jgi:hypothetical protein